MNQRFPCFVKEHNWPNCFAYTTTSTLNGDLNYKNPPSYDNQRFALIRSCEDANRKLYVQLNGDQRFQYVLINAKLMEFAGFTDNEEALIEFVEPTSCDAVEVSPLSEGDFQVIESNVYEIESSFLNQCRLVASGMIVPFFSNAGRPVLLKIVKIHPETDKPVLLTAHTELHVAPVTNGFLKQSNREEKRNSEEKFSKLFTDLNQASTSAVNEEYFDNILPPTHLRVLPRELRKGLDQCLHINDVYAMHTDKTQPYGSTLYVSIKTMRPSCREFFAIFHLISHGSQHDEKIEKLKILLKKYPGHCLVSSVSPLSEYEILKTSDRLIEAGDLLSLTLDNDVRKLSEATSILLGNHGTTIKTILQGSPLTYQLCSPFKELMNHPQNGKHICFRVSKSTRPIIRKTFMETSLPQEEQLLNYGFEAPIKLKDFKFQDDLLDQLTKWIDFSWDLRNDTSNNHSLLLGDRGTGKTALLQEIAKSLAKSEKVIFCRRIDCSMWKGKQAEKIRKQLLVELNLGIVRSPSVIILDGIDLIAPANKDEEHRMVQLERIFAMLRDLLKPRKLVQIVCSARSLHSIHPILLGDGGQRFFGYTVEIPKLSLHLLCVPSACILRLSPSSFVTVTIKSAVFFEIHA
ncbi:unnamed protein product, partial [Mesorhabditis belari]|uniref:Peroxisomal ATPase PEX1 n=1 Tax=Mesorhabditis belari TaxID=2138241 RepID=A0AAF3FSH2_9BILA